MNEVWRYIRRFFDEEIGSRRALVKFVGLAVGVVAVLLLGQK